MPLSPLGIVPDFLTSFHLSPLEEWSDSAFVSWPGIACSWSLCEKTWWGTRVQTFCAYSELACWFSRRFYFSMLDVKPILMKFNFPLVLHVFMSLISWSSFSIAGFEGIQNTPAFFVSVFCKCVLIMKVRIQWWLCVINTHSLEEFCLIFIFWIISSSLIFLGKQESSYGY